jgi:hypothetical protein
MSPHNPILGREDFPRISLFMSRPAVEPGIALVLFRENGEVLTLIQGQRLTAGDIAWGSYKGFYKVDIALHSFAFQVNVPCSKDAFNFQADVQVTYQVENPTEIVKCQIRDIQGVLQPEIIKQMRTISRKYNAEQSEEAEQEINNVFERGLRVNGILASRIVANLELEAASRDHLRVIQNIINQKAQQTVAHELNIMKNKHDFELNKIKMESYAPLIQEGQWNLLALHLAEHPDDVATISSMMTQQRQIELENQLKILKVMLEEDVIEGFHIEKVGKCMLQRLVDSLGLFDTKSLSAGNGSKKLPRKSSCEKIGANNNPQDDDSPENIIEVNE